MPLREIRLPKFPECWESCGGCAQGEVSILEIFVAPGKRVARGDVILTLETGKVALDIFSPHAGIVREVLIAEGDVVDEGALLVTLTA
ncbi:MAG: lipoyl domain-containing protein [Azoarcus sp.]|jgi:pyruvate/2-oxoglutarate dehydrogenase complex dihydrolipoamide acyltransferase (E2) component|nr:lipoyl domain-containing protein [Azoarcus sp.]